MTEQISELLLLDHIAQLTAHVKSLIEFTKHIVKYEKNPDELHHKNTYLIDKFLSIQNDNLNINFLSPDYDETIKQFLSIRYNFNYKVKIPQAKKWLVELSQLWAKLHHRLYIDVPARVGFLRM